MARELMISLTLIMVSGVGLLGVTAEKLVAEL